MAQVLPLVASIGAAAVSSALAPKPKAPPAPPPLPPAENTTEPEGALDQEAVRSKALRRKAARSERSNLLSLIDTPTVSSKTLLGE